MRNLWWCLVLAGCGGGLERVTYVTDHLEYPPGGRVMLSLGNVSATQVKVNLCLSQLVLETGEPSGSTNSETCESLEGEVIEPGAQVSVRKTLPRTLSGRFRYEATIVLPTGAGERVLTPAFLVQ